MNGPIETLIQTGVLESEDRANIVSTFVKNIEYAYPIPTLERDAILENVIPSLERQNIYSRGRFGLWRVVQDLRDRPGRWPLPPVL